MLKSIVGQKARMLFLGLAWVFGAIMLIGLLWTMSSVPPLAGALAQGVTLHYVAPGGNDSGNDCLNFMTPCSTIQHAVDVAGAGDEIRVAEGSYTDVHTRPRADIEASGIVTQVVYLSKTLTIRGGYRTSDWTTPYPLTQPTMLDAQGQGRVLYITGAISPTLEGLHISGGDAANLGGAPSGIDAGGGVYAITATTTLSNSQLFSNTAQIGGGFATLYSQDVTLANNIVFGNTGWNAAGGIFIRNSPGPTLKANTIRDNIADHVGGGQKHHGGVSFLFSDNALLVDNIVSDNRAADSCGGIIFNVSENATLIGNTIRGNHAGSHGFGINAGGGGLCFSDSDGANLSRNLVTGNSTNGHGGGLRLARSDIRMINNVIADNQILATSNFTGTGNGLHVAGSSLQLAHTTIARNSGGDGSGLTILDSFGTFSRVGMTNTILVDHDIGLTVNTSNTVTLDGVLWHNNGINSSGMGTVTVTNGYTGDPAFAADGYHLTAGSAAIDKGISTGIDDDIDGQRRPCLTASDLGADEQFCHFNYLPVIFNGYDPQAVELTGILRAADICVFCCYPSLLETNGQLYELIAWGVTRYNGHRVRVRGLRQGTCEWNGRPLILPTSIEILE